MATLLKGDCLKVMATLPDKSVECFICDLPYGQLHAGRKQDGKWYDKRQNGGPSSNWDVKINLDEFWKQVKRLCKNEHTPVLMFCNTRFGYELIKSNEKWFRYDLVWDKGHGVSFLSANKMPMKSHEMVYVFSKAGAYYKRINVKGDFKKAVGGAGYSTHYGNIRTHQTIDNTGQRCPLSVIRIGGRSAGGHPTEKPKELYEWLLQRYVPEGGTVLDPTAGSFNSILVARKLGFKAIGIEMDNDFYWKGVKKFA
jgi:DNA modification methylase